MSALTSSQAELEALLEALPECGLNCLVKAVETQSDCSPSDAACACANRAVQANANLCVAHTCIVPDALTTQNLTNTLCGISSDHDGMYIKVIYTFVVVASLFVALRFVARLTRRNPLWWDDYAVLISLLIAVGFTILCGTYDTLGVGLDIWAVPQENLQTILILLWAALLCYPMSRCFVRVSISLFLLRIFRVSGARPLIILTLVLNVAMTITFVFCVIFQCTPVSFFWRGWDGLHDGHCVDQWALFLAGGCITTSLDIFLILLPFRWIYQLQFSLAKKITTLAMFSLGAIVVVTSIMRLVSLYSFTHSHNVTRNIPGLVIWGGLELYVAVICACLPSLRPLFDLLPSWLRVGDSRYSKGNGASSSAPSHPQFHGDGGKKLSSGSRGRGNEPCEPGRDVTAKPPDAWLTTIMQQQRSDRSPAESEINLTTLTTDDVS